ncbi:hypothetical protein [Vibrio sp. B1Z05]|uniref:hypothetical protein n=1 Tax=Vibrio sp. B1Z05 TaxID=2654980 RepID=UPI00128C1026|nr:hypothetical protein [Vibrio sp. B1Z05]MPW37319.1 hypothetical protein [Vibrio sp. B1Z05]
MPFSALASVPYVFHDGDVASASDMNDNFQALETQNQQSQKKITDLETKNKQLNDELTQLKQQYSLKNEGPKSTLQCSIRKNSLGGSKPVNQMDMGCYDLLTTDVYVSTSGDNLPSSILNDGYHIIDLSIVRLASYVDYIYIFEK